MDVRANKTKLSTRAHPASMIQIRYHIRPYAVCEPVRTDAHIDKTTTATVRQRARRLPPVRAYTALVQYIISHNILYNELLRSDIFIAEMIYIAGFRIVYREVERAERLN